MHRSSESIGAIAAALSKAQAELTKLRALSVASLLAEAVKRIHNEESVSSLFA